MDLDNLIDSKVRGNFLATYQAKPHGLQISQIHNVSKFNFVKTTCKKPLG